MGKKVDIAQEIIKGGELPKNLLSKQEELIQLAQHQGLAVFTVDCSKARNLSAVLRAFAKAVDFPVFFGKDLEAFLDCLQETLLEQKVGCFLWIHELHSGDPDLADDAKEVLTALQAATKHAKDKKKVFSYIVQHAGKHAAPELGREPAHYIE